MQLNKLGRPIYLYLVIFLFSIGCHIVLMKQLGTAVSHDFKAVYNPNAVQIADWMKGTSQSPVFVGSEYYVTHSVYILMMSLIYFLFGTGNVNALISVQIILSSLLYVLILKILLENCSSKLIAVLFTVIAILNFNNLQWTFYGSPESLYRFLFIFFYYFLIRMFFLKKLKSFMVLFLLFFLLLFFTRGDTVILFIPVYILVYFAIKKSMTGFGRYFFAGCAVVIIFSLLLFQNEVGKVAGIVVDTFTFYYDRGDIVADVNDVIVGTTTLGTVQEGQSIWYHIVRGIKLFFLRIYYFVTIFPPFWSKIHNVYYAVFIVPIYIGAIAGIRRVIKLKDLKFFMFFSGYLSSMILHGLTRIDASHRTTITAITLLIMFAGYGYDYLLSIYGKSIFSFFIFGKQHGSG